MEGKSQTLPEMIGIAIFALPLIVCSLEMVPGWGVLGLTWPPAVFFGVMGVCGAIAGVLSARYRVLGLVAGAAAGLGALGLLYLALSIVPAMPKFVFLVLAVLGAIPGYVLYLLLAYLLHGANPLGYPAPGATAEDGEDV